MQCCFQFIYYEDLWKLLLKHLQTLDPEPPGCGQFTYSTEPTPTWTKQPVVRITFSDSSRILSLRLGHAPRKMLIDAPQCPRMTFCEPQDLSVKNGAKQHWGTHQEPERKGQLEDFVLCSKKSNLQFNMRKTKELVVEFWRDVEPLTAVTIGGGSAVHQNR